MLDINIEWGIVNRLCFVDDIAFFAESETVYSPRATEENERT